MNDETLTAWVAQAIGHKPKSPALFRRALTHGSYGPDSYERLEFLGDRVLGLSTAAWLYELFPSEPEGVLSRRFNAVVSREACAQVGRAIGVDRHVVLGKQARDDGGSDSDNIVGDVVEALLGAVYLEAGLPAVEAFIRRAWADLVAGQQQAPRHPKSELQEWAAAHRCRAPVYTLIGRSGPHHAPTFSVTVAIPGRSGAEAQAEGSSKQEAETAAARVLLEKLA